MESRGIPISISDLQSDLRRVLRVQFKEFLHYIDDSQTEQIALSKRQAAVNHSVAMIGRPRWQNIAK